MRFAAKQTLTGPASTVTALLLRAGRPFFSIIAENVFYASLPLEGLFSVRPRDVQRSSETQATSLSLLAAAKTRDAAAWDRLVKLYSPLVCYWCQRASLKPEDAADVMQEVFRAVARGLGRFERSSRAGSFRGWLVTITTNKIRDLARRKARQPAAVGGSDYQQFLAQLPEELDSEDSRATGDSLLVRRAVELVSAEFEPRTWQAFWKTTAESLATEDVGRQLGMTGVAVRKAKSRVLRRLREVLAEEME